MESKRKKVRAARKAAADLANSVPNTQDGFMFNDKDFSYDSGMQVDDSGAATTNPALADRIPTNRDSSGIYYDQVGQAMTIPEVKAYAARHNLTLQQQQQKNKS